MTRTDVFCDALIRLAERAGITLRRELLKANSGPIAFKSTVIERAELEKLMNSNCIEIKPTNKYTVIKIVYYESYI